MNAPPSRLHDEEDDEGEVYLDEADIIQELPVDEEGPLSLSRSRYICFVSLSVLVLCACLWMQIYLMQRTKKPALI